MKKYDSYEDMQARIAQEKVDAAAEQHLLETTDDTAVADAIFDKRRRDPSRSKHDRILDEDEWRKAGARAERKKNPSGDNQQ
jgi:ferritin-like metal-binding protein YciE